MILRKIRLTRNFIRQYGTSSSRPPIIQISNGVFYRHHPNGSSESTHSNPALFSNLNFELPSFSSRPEHWAVLGPSSSGKTTFLQILRGQHLCIPPLARSYPFLSSDEIEQKGHSLRDPHRAIQCVGFGSEQGGGTLGGQGTQGAYLSARYESRCEVDDFSVLNYLQGRTELNPLSEEPQEAERKRTDEESSLRRVTKDLRLADLLDMPVSNLSNGQMRRAKIARALLGRPEVLLLDEPFMGLDPPTLMSLSPLLHGLAAANAPRLVLGLRPQDPIPDWITHLIFLRGNCEVAFSGTKTEFLKILRGRGERSSKLHIPEQSMHEVGRELTSHGSVEGGSGNSNSISTKPSIHAPKTNTEELKHEKKLEARLGEPLVEMSGVRVSYGSKTVLGNWTQPAPSSNSSPQDPQPKKPLQGLFWTVRRGERWGIFGPNGSGKTTLLSLISSDHPQTYSLPIKLFGRPRLPEPGQRGVSIFDLQSRIGHSSPEIHHHMPRSLTLRKVLASAWAETFLGMPVMDEGARMKVEACLRWFEDELRLGGGGGAGAGRSALGADAVPGEGSTAWADEVFFGELPFSAQRVALFVRAVIKNPDLVILDEAFSGMDDVVRDKCMLFLEHGETRPQTYASRPFSASSDGDHPTTNVPSSSSPSSAAGNRNTNTTHVSGLTPQQALLCISHVREEVPACVREWICLPEANEGKSAKFGRLEEGDEVWDKVGSGGKLGGKGWGEIWGF